MANAFDVIICGGGPAGGAAAITLAKAGCQIALVERADYREVRVGESLAPAARVSLAKLGVWEPFVSQGHLASPGIVASWGRAEPYENDFVFLPYGNGWNLDRSRFDELLALTAESSGADLRQRTEVLRCEREAKGGWRISVRHGNSVEELHGRFLIHATGRRPRRFGSVTPRHALDQLVGVVKVLSLRARSSEPDPRIWIEARPEGWWYSALLPNDRMVFAWMTDRDLLRRGRSVLNSFWRATLAVSPLTRERLATCTWSDDLRLHEAHSSFRLQSVGSDWAAVGDAAMALDPLSGHGICKALAQGSDVAQQYLSGWPATVDELQHRQDKELRAVVEQLRLRRQFYLQETRWHDYLFWQRRHQLGHANDLINWRTDGLPNASTFGHRPPL